MDALFESINVQDLLPGSDLGDPTTPLAAPDLRLLIQRLDAHSVQVKARIQAYLSSHRREFSDLFSLCGDAVSRSGEISDAVHGLAGAVSDRPVDAEIADLLAEMTVKMREQKAKRALLELVRAIVEINDKLGAVREGLRNGRLRFAAEGLRDLKEAVRISGDESEREPLVYGLLKREWSDCFEEIQELLLKLMGRAVRFDADSNAVRIDWVIVDGHGSEMIELHAVLEALEVLGILDCGLAKVADLMIKHAVSAAVSIRLPASFTEELAQDSEQMKGAVLKIIPSHDLQVEDEGKAIYSGISQIIRFFGKWLCFQNSPWVTSFGRLTWPRISDMIISNFLSKVVPQDASKLAGFQKIIEHTSEFEAELKELGFISTSDDKDRRLSEFAENVEVHFASRKKIEILANARKLLLQCDFAIPKDNTKDKNSSEHVVQLLFRSEKCVVSRAALQLMELVHWTLKGVCLSSSRVASEFYHVTRDILLLYEVVIPVKLERQLESINQVAVLMHNDCLYLSQEILALAYEYRPDFPSSIKDHAVFIDLAPRFQRMADEILERQVQLILYNLREAIDGADGFQNSHLQQEYESAKFSIDQVVFILEKVRIIWEPLLVPSTYRRSMCLVLDSVFSRIARDILLIDDMAAEETLQLRSLIKLMVESLSSPLESLMSHDQIGNARNAHESTTQALHHLVPSLVKIRKLAELLDMPLKSITAAWESGDLFSCGFTAKEVQDFIKAIFADSPLRKECLWRLENVSF